MISFSGETYEGQFWKQILEGRKTQTCRKPRKRPIKKGDKLYLYWKVRMRKTWKPIHFIGEALCTEVERRKYGDFALDDDFARRDGFHDALELQQWFGDPLESAEEEYDVIHFELISRPIHYLVGCLFCKKTFPDKSGFDDCVKHMDKEHFDEMMSNRMTYPINYSKQFKNGKWITFIP